MRKARAVFDNFPIAVIREWNQRADRLNRIPVSGRFQDEPPAVLLGDLSTVYNNHLFHDTLYCFKQIRRYLTAGYDRQNTQKEIRLARNDTATIGTYIYINDLFVPSLLKLALFGNNYNYINMAIFESAAK